MKELYFVRHGQTEWNAIRRMQGQWNSDLNELGREQADINGRFLAGLDIQHIVASPLDRTRQTAEIITRYVRLPVHYDDRIMEWNCGDWSGEMWNQVSEKWPEAFAAWQADQFNYRGPGCENYPDMIDRATPFLEEIKAHQAERIAVVSHGMIGRVMVSTLLGHSPEQMFRYGQPNDVVFLLQQTDDGFIARHYVSGEGPHDNLPPRHY